jgi:DNA polymerase elongation subunit (family B)
LPLEVSKKIEALKQYYGVTQTGQMVVRGVEIRRHGTPKLTKEFQTELLCTLFDCKNANEIFDKGFDNLISTSVSYKGNRQDHARR